MKTMLHNEAVMDFGIADTRTYSPQTLILLIEDDPQMQKVLHRIFREQGYGVTVCGDGQSGLDAFRSIRPSAVILDLMLPTFLAATSARS